MAKRIYFESLKKWGIRTGLTGISVFALLFIYLQFTGLITITSHSGDVICAGTEKNPCYAKVNFMANDDIFIYPVEYDPWGRNTPFNFSDGLSGWKIERSWGKGWREIKLNETCTGTWCGAPDNKGVKYSFVFRRGRTYKIRITGYKENPTQDIKWGFANLDPIWYGIEKKKGNWTSPAHWLYVIHNEKTKTIETSYGDFAYKDGLNLTKNGEYLGSLDVGIEGRSKGNIKYLVICNETERECNLTMDYGDSKLIVNFDRFRAKINYEYLSNRTKIVSERIKFYFELSTPSKTKNKYDTITVFKNGMLFDYSDINNTRFNGKPVLDKAEFKDGKLKVETKLITLLKGERIYLDPTWTTPSGVISFSSEGDFAYQAVESIDDDISGGYDDYWMEDSSPADQNEGDYEWYITYDMGSSECIHAIRIYTDGNSQDSPCKVVTIKVCDDAACSGESNLIASECTFSTTKEWQECTLDTDTQGRYIFLEGGKDGNGCENKEATDDMTYFHEFDADTDGSCAPVDSTLPTYSLNSTNSTLAGTVISHNLNWTDDIGLSGYTFSFLNESDAVGFAYDEDGDDLAIFYRNGSFSVDTAITTLSIDATLTDDFGTYTIPTGFSYYDILGIMYDSDLNDMAVFFRNGSYASDVSVGFTDATIEFTGSYSWNLWTIPNDFKIQDIIGFTFDGGGNDGVVFFGNGSLLVDTGILDWTATIDFYEIHDYTKYTDVDIEDCIGFAYDSAADDICMYLLNKSDICDVSQTGLRTQIGFDDKIVDFTIFSDYNIGFVNDTWVAFGGGTWSNVTKAVTDSINATIRWCCYVNDTSNNWNRSSCDSPFNYLTTTIPPEDTCTPPASGDWNVLCSDNCFKSDENIDIVGNLNIYGVSAGTFTINNVNLSFDSFTMSAGNCKIIRHPPFKWIQKG